MKKSWVSNLWVWFLPFFVLGSGFLSFHWVASALLHSRPEVPVPDVTGKSLEQALDLLSGTNLGLFKESVEFDEGVPPGSILRQVPPAGLKVREGKMIRVVLSSGGKIVFVPDLVGVSLMESQNRLRSAGFVLGAVSQVYSVVTPEGAVMSQYPGAGTTAKPGAMVDLKVSRGTPAQGQTLFPNFVGRPLVDAQTWAEEQGFYPDVRIEENTKLPEGMVLRQSPDPDTAVSSGTVITFVASPSPRANKGITVEYPPEPTIP